MSAGDVGKSTPALLRMIVSQLVHDGHLHAAFSLADSLQLPVIASKPGSSRLAQLVSYALQESGRTTEMEVDIITNSSAVAADTDDVQDNVVLMGGLDLDAPEPAEGQELPVPLYRYVCTTFFPPRSSRCVSCVALPPSPLFFGCLPPCAVCTVEGTAGRPMRRCTRARRGSRGTTATVHCLRQEVRMAHSRSAADADLRDSCCTQPP